MDTLSNDEKVDLGNSNSNWNGFNKLDAKIVTVTGLTRNVIQEHLRTMCIWVPWRDRKIRLAVVWGMCTSDSNPSAQPSFYLVLMRSF